MNNIRLTFNSSTNISLPLGVYYVLQDDALAFGFIKNNKPNINGFLNELIPSLSNYQEDLNKKLLEYNDGDEELARICAGSIHNVYLKPFAFVDYDRKNVPFRINKDKYDVFITIHDERLRFYNTDFSNYIRTLLSEYALKKFDQREYLYAFEMTNQIKDAIINQNVCIFYLDQEVRVFAPFYLDIDRFENYVYVLGSNKSGQPEVIRLTDIKKVSVLEEQMDVTEEMFNMAYCLFRKICMAKRPENTGENQG